jgi:hypothetical protein
MQYNPAPDETARPPLIERRSRPRHQAPAEHPARGLITPVPGLEVRESSWAEWDDAYEALNCPTLANGAAG